MKLEILLAVVRHMLTGLGGVLVAKGWADDSQISEAAGALCTLIGFGWSLWHKRQAARKILPLLLFLASLPLLSGCTVVRGLRTPEGQLSIDATSFMTSVDGMQFSCTDKDGFTTTLDLQKAGVDNQALTTVTSGLLKMAELGAFLAAPPTNTVPAAPRAPPK